MYKDINSIENLITLDSITESIADTCNKCGICQEDCAFLTHYGNPGSIAEKYKNPDRWTSASFECSLCGMCSSVCPQKLDPAAMFFEFRKDAVEKGQGDFSEHQTLLNYEQKGTSQKYTLYSLPENCDTVFFPGCSLPGTRPGSTLKSYQYLQKHIENIGIVLDCCTKPSNDLGQQDYFEKMFSELKNYLLEQGINTIIVACPNCYKIFNTYGQEFTTDTIYHIMSQKGLDDQKTVPGQVTIHDPCPTRFENKIHDSVRSVIKKRGLEIIDTPHIKSKTFCCGEGGAAGCLSPEFAREWTQKRTRESRSDKIASYCAGCVNLLSKKGRAFHILDLVFEPDKTMAGKATVSSAPFTYLNRLNLKKKLKQIPVKTIRERTFSAREKKKENTALKRIMTGFK